MHVVLPVALDGNGTERLIGALDNALCTDVLPGSRSVLSENRQVLVLHVIEAFPGRLHDVGGGHNNARGEVVGLEDGDRHTGLHNEGLVVFQRLERVDDRVVGFPVTGALAVAAVDNEHFGNLGILHVVFEHTQDGFLLPALAAKRIRLVKTAALSLYLVKDLGLFGFGSKHITAVLRHLKFLRSI